MKKAIDEMFNMLNEQFSIRIGISTMEVDAIMNEITVNWKITNLSEATVIGTFSLHSSNWQDELRIIDKRMREFLPTYLAR